MFKPNYRLTKYLAGLLEHSSAVIPRIKVLSSSSKLRMQVVRDSLGRGVHSSTWIEGNQLSLAQVLAIVEGKDVSADLHQKTEVKNCVEVLRWAIKYKKAPVTSAKILMLHAKMVRGLLPKDRCGRWRKVQNYVVNARGQIIDTPPIPQEVPRRMKELLSWVSSSSLDHTVVRAAIFHHEFVKIHPFVDGNGRMARALSQWILIQGGYDPAYSLSVDEYFAADRSKYYQMIRETKDMDGDYTYWIEYYAQGILEAMQALVKRLRSIKADGKEWTPKQRELLELLRKNGVLGSKAICQVMGINRARVNQLIGPLISAGAVIKEGHTSSTRYRVI